MSDQRGVLSQPFSLFPDGHGNWIRSEPERVNLFQKNNLLIALHLFGLNRERGGGGVLVMRARGI